MLFANNMLQVSYRNPTGEPFVLTVPGCKAACPLIEFENLTKKIIPVNWDNECLDWWERFEYKNNVVTILGSEISLIVFTFSSTNFNFNLHCKKLCHSSLSLSFCINFCFFQQFYLH